MKCSRRNDANACLSGSPARESRDGSGYRTGRNRSSAPWLGELAVPNGHNTRWVDMRVDPIADRWGDVAGRLVVTRDVTVRKVLEGERERLIAELKKALSEVRALEELLPICASCKKVRDDKGYWSQIDVYLQTRAAVEFTHGICPDCTATIRSHPRP